MWTTKWKRAAIVKMGSDKAVNEDAGKGELGFIVKTEKVDIFGKYFQGKERNKKSAKRVILTSA